MTTLKTVLVLCTGNSCRSQMAEAILNHDLAGQVRALSAGTSPQAQVAEGALAALQLAGLPTAGLVPKSVDTMLATPIDLVVTVCDHANETCPMFPKPIPKIHVGFSDPDGKDYGAFILTCKAIEAELLPRIAEALNA